MKRITENHLLLSIMTVIAAYIVTNYVLPNAIFARSMSIALMISGCFALWRFAPTAWDIVIKKLRLEKDNSAHFVVLGLTLLAIGSVYQGAYGFIWDYLNRPDAWVGTWFSRLGQLSMVSGFFMLFRSPDLSTGPIKIKNAILLAVLITLSLFGAFLAGRGSATMDDDLSMYFRIHGAQKPYCGPDTPIWISKSGKIHDRFSQYRNQVIPKACFKNTSDAIKAGYLLLGSKPGSAFETQNVPNIQPLPTLPDTE